ncbi:MAG: cytochrome c oxidase subunit 3 [Rhizomicrobium sp.]
MSGASFVTKRSWSEPEQEFRASFGIWVFLATELLFFGALFLAYAELRSQNYVAFAEAGKHASFFYGTLNTFILMTSSLAIAIAVGAQERADIRLVRWALAATLVFGLGFLIVKGLEYHEDIEEHLIPGAGFPSRMPAAQMFFALYWVMTGLHAIHLTVGLGVVGRVWRIARRSELPENFHRTLEVSALYWHLIDVFWVMLYPIFYLVGRST